jgi:hypothetical protein
MLVCCLSITSSLPSVYVQWRIDSRDVHTCLLVVGTKYQYSESRCSAKILVCEHWLVIGYVYSYIDGPSVVYIVLVEIFARMQSDV